MASSSSSSPIGQKREVFLSFRGEDTRNNFTSHLHKALIGKSIDTFIDDNLERGEEISSALLKTIEESMISIVILSKNYASSSWCLDELSKIIECKKTNGQIVVPIFYHVDPADVRKQTGKFGDKFAKCEERFRDMTDKVERWRAALTEVGSVSGWHSQNDRPDSILLDDIVEDIMKKLYHTSSGDFNGLIGIDSRIEHIEPLLCIGLESACIAVGIWGMGGIGKTTIAKAIFHKFSSQFEGCCFLENVREVSEEKDGVVSLRKKLGEILGDENMKRGNVSLHRVGRKKVLIVLDDVDDSSQLETIIGRFDWFGKGSRIIITTRNKHVLKRGVKIHEVEKLNFHEALRLLEVFKQDHPMEDFMELSKMVVNYAQGIPLVLKVLGSFLFGRSKREWKSALDRLKETPDPTIQKVLRISYDGLQQTEKDIFCDIAWFFKGWNKDHVMKILHGCDLFPDIGIKVLVEKSLITISNNILDMHDLLQEMGLEIVREVSKEPGKRSRLRNAKDVYHVLTEETGTEAVEGIFLDSFSSSIPSQASLKSTAFQGMCNLRYLMLRCGDKLHFPDGLKYLSNKLVYLQLRDFPLESFPLNFHLENLVELDMSYGKVKYLWEGTLPLSLSKLRVITIHYCKDLIKIPDLLGVPNLERMDLLGCEKLTSLPGTIKLTSLRELMLRFCSNLRELPDSLGKLSSLKKLHVEGCSNLKELPDSLGNLSSLSELYLKGCSNLKKLPDSLGNLSSLGVLDLENCSNLKELPVSLGNLSSLGVLDLKNCSNLKELPDSLGNLSSLRELQLGNCSNLKELPDSLGNLSSLGVFDLKNCSNLKELPDSLDNLSSLRELQLGKCLNLKELPDNLGNLSSLGELHLENCSNLKELPDSLGNLLSLKDLHLENLSNLKELPDNLGNLSSLGGLYLENCSNLKELPDSLVKLSSLEDLWLENCSNLKELPDSLGKLSSLVELDLRDCSNLKELPDSLGKLSSLWGLYLRNCSNLKELPDSLGNLSSLQVLDLGNCSNLKKLPDSLSNLSSLRVLDLDNCSNLKELPDSLDNLSLRVLDLDGCSKLKELPYSLGNLSSLEALRLENCSNLKELPDNLGNLTSLGELYLRNCSNLKELPDSLGNLSFLRELHLEDCPKLTELPDSIGNLSFLRELHLEDCSNLKELPDSIGNLSFLGELHLEDCSNLKELPDSIGNLSLGELFLENCSNLTELPDSLSNLSSLRRLSLSRNNIVRIPASIKHFSQLTFLDLRNCKRLQSLPQLPSCLKEIWADNCISLQTISFSSSSSIRVTGTEQDLSIPMVFKYQNCLKLDQNSRSNIEADAQLKILLLATTILKKNKCNSFKLVCPGSEIPDWFSYRSTGCRLPEKLPLDLGNSKFLGFAVCVIATSKGNSFGVCCEMETLNGKFSSAYHDFNRIASESEHMLIASESEHMFLWNVSCLDLRNKLGDDWHSNNETSFKFCPSGDTVVKKCGVHALYECNLSMIQSRSPNENFGDVDQGLLEPMAAEEGSNDHNIRCDDDEHNGTEEEPPLKKLKF